MRYTSIRTQTNGAALGWRQKINNARAGLITKRHRFVACRIRPLVQHSFFQNIKVRADLGFFHLERAGIERTAAMVAAVVTVLCMSLVLTAQTKHSFRVFADEKRVVQIYVDGAQRNVVSSGATVKDILSENGVDVRSGDVVEPELDTVVDQPNYNINVYRAAPAVVIDSGKFTQVVTGYRSARKIAAAAGLTLYPEDRADIEQVQDFQPSRTLGYKVTIDRAVPVQLVVGTELYNVRTQSATVGELLKEKQIEYDLQDLQGVSIDTPLTPGVRVVLSKISQQTEVKLEDIEPATQTIYDANMESGKTETRRSGVRGRKQVTYLVETADGQAPRRSVLEEKVLVPAIDAIIVRGTKFVSRGGQPTAEQWARLRFCESGGWYGNNKNSLYRGAYQFSYGTWNNYGGYHDPADAPPEVQDAAAFALYARRGAQPWPVCGRYLR
jgi:uncharacterized protein YabE (DUF348 family)